MSASVTRMLAELGPLGNPALAAIREHGSIGRAAQVPEAVRRRFPIALEMPPRRTYRCKPHFRRTWMREFPRPSICRPTRHRRQLEEVFLEAHRLNLKGVTVYRYGSFRPGQTLSLVEDENFPIAGNVRSSE